MSEHDAQMRDRLRGALEVKFAPLGAARDVEDGLQVEGYASLYQRRDRGGDVVMPGAYAASLRETKRRGSSVKMLWQHDPGRPIGVWDELREDDRGLYVRGRVLDEVATGREAIALIRAGAIDGLSIGYRVKRAERDGNGQRRLVEIELWEVSLVTFPMLPDARLDRAGKSAATTMPARAAGLHALAAHFTAARRALAGGAAPSHSKKDG